VIVTLAIGMTLGMLVGGLGRRARQPDTAVAAAADPSIAARALAPVLHACEDAIVLTDASLRIQYANEAFAKLCGRTIDVPSETTVVEAVRHSIASGDDFARDLADVARHGEREATGEVTEKDGAKELKITALKKVS
jgi:PAS domain-containing protein